MPIQIDMDMPKNCRECAFMVNDEESLGECCLLPIKDFDGKIVNFQKVCIDKDINAGNVRNKHCPLKEVK